MKYKRHILIMALAVSAFLVTYFFQSGKQKTVKPMAEPFSEALIINYSRVTFFNTAKHRASLAIPDYWEGRYRIREEGDTVVFLDINEPRLPKELFWIRYKSLAQQEKDDSQEWRELVRADNVIFSYKLSTAKGEKNKKFDNMLLETESVIKSFLVN